MRTNNCLIEEEEALQIFSVENLRDTEEKCFAYFLCFEEVV